MCRKRSEVCHISQSKAIFRYGQVVLIYTTNYSFPRFGSEIFFAVKLIRVPTEQMLMHRLVPTFGIHIQIVFTDQC